MYALSGQLLWGCYLDFMKLMRNTESLVLKLMVIGNRVLSTLKEYRC